MFPLIALAVAILIAIPIVCVIMMATVGRRLRDVEARLGSAEVRAQRLTDEFIQLRASGQRPRQNGTGIAPGAVPDAPMAAGDTPTATGVEAATGPRAPAQPLASGDPSATLSGAGSVPPMPPQAPAVAATPPSGPSSPTSLEERLGTRWAVWVGGVALALGGLLLARYSIEQGYFGPGARIVMGLAFAAGLIAAGEWFRRGERAQLIAVVPSAHIPGILTAAGTATAFGTIYAAHALYEFIGPATAFGSLGLVGIATMLAAALHGPALAGLGLAGAYVAPLLVSSARPDPWPVVIYLGVVAASAMGLARVRHWLWLAALAVAGAVAWGIPFIGRIPTADINWQLAGDVHVLIQLVLAAGFLAIAPNLSVRDHLARPDPVASGALGALTLLAIGMLVEDRANLTALVPFILCVIAILLAAAWFSPPAAAAAVFAGLVALAGVVSWPGLKASPDATLLAPALAGVLRLPENVTSFMIFAGLAAFAVFAIAGLRLLRGRALAPATAGLYALAATATPLLALVLAYLRIKQFDNSIPFALAGLALAALFVVAADRFQKAEIPEFAGTRLATGAFAAAAIAAVCFGMVACLERGYLTVALALAALGTAYIAVLRDIPLLRHVVAALAGIVLARIGWNPRIMGDGVGKWPILNWLLVGYGIPAAAFWASARMLDTKGPTVAARIADATAILLAGLLGFFQIHHALNAGDMLAPTTGHVEQGLLALLALGFSWALMRLDLGRANPVFRWGSMAFGVISAGLIGLGLGLFENPLFARDRVAGPAVFSSLLLAYLLPGLGAAALSRAARPHRPRWYVTGIAVLALLLVFGYVTLEIRHVFQGEDIRLFRRSIGGAEQWAYSVGWLALGIAFLAYGIGRASLEARLASAALVFLSVGKVFIFDLGGLTGLWRALSLIVLGLVLIGIGLVYQNFVFARPARPPVAPTAPQ